MWIETENFLAFGVQQELNGRHEIAQTFFTGLALTLRARNL